MYHLHYPYLVKARTDYAVSVRKDAGRILGTRSAKARETSSHMRRQLANIIAATVSSVLLTAPVTSAQQKQPSSKEKQAPSKSQTTTMTGCVDQQDSRFVLIHDQTRSKIANLEAEGFPDEGFAKHVGHKVTVRGTSIPAGTERPTFKVRSIERVSESCGSPQH